MGDAYPELRARQGARRAGAEAGGRALRRDARERHEDARSSALAERRQGARRRDGVHALRHVRLPARPHRRRLPRARRRRSTRRASTRRWTRSASARAPRASSRRARSSTTPGGKTAFRGYDTLSDEGRVVALYKDGVGGAMRSRRASAASSCSTATPFYAESGGQVGDRGELTKGGACLTLFAVEDTQKIQPDVFGHHRRGRRPASSKVGDTVAAQVDHAARARTMRNHSATHLMHKALREVLGAHVQQKGSLVDPDKTRFDFAHNAPMTDDEIRRVEAIVNAEILAQRADAGARDADRRRAEVRRDDAVRREVRRRSARARHRHARASCAAARTSRAPATSASSRSSAKAASRPASAASRR